MDERLAQFLEALQKGDRRTALKVVMQEIFDSGGTVERDRIVFKKASGKRRKCQSQPRKN
jgi:hypothetical protein